MRTTVDLPDELFRAAKVRAAERGETLRELFTRLLSRELKNPVNQHEGGRVSLPLVGNGSPSVTVTNADIETALATQDADRYGS